MKKETPKNILLFANGEVVPASVDRVRDRQFDYVVAADGGVQNALNFGFKPDVVIGDFDSITPELQSKLPETRFLHRPSQDVNDLHKALDFCVESGVQIVTILGLTGKRFDHSLNNFSVLCHFDTQLDLHLFEGKSQIFIVRQGWKFSGEPGKSISLIPLGTVEGVTTSGLRWELQNETLAMGVREGCSNESREKTVKVTIQRGILLIFVNE